MEAEGRVSVHTFCLNPLDYSSPLYIFMGNKEDSQGAPRFPHQPVLLKEAIELLRPSAGQTIVDCTVGTGGHSIAILPRLMPNGRLIAIDCDDKAIDLAQKRLIEFRPNIEFIHDNFSHLPEILKHIGLEKVDAVIADLGISSLHVEQPDRGFSFMREGPLDMRMDQNQTETAQSLIRRLSEKDIELILYEYGQERWARRIAKGIVQKRRKHPLRSTIELANIVLSSIPSKKAYHRIHPATKTFQAIRMAVNNELGSLEKLLESLRDVLLPGGRAAIISFHSLEDRLVKQAFRKGKQEGAFRILTDKPITPSESEQETNPRSRSAKLRVVEKIG